MTQTDRLPSIALALSGLLLTGCSDDSSTNDLTSSLKKTGQDVAEQTKAAGEKIGDELGNAAQGLEDFAKDIGDDMQDTAQVVGDKIESKMPDLEKLVSQAKVKLEAAGADAKDAASKLDDKLAGLKTKLAELKTAGANATKEMRDGVVAAFRDLVDSIQDGLEKLTG